MHKFAVILEYNMHIIKERGVLMERVLDVAQFIFDEYKKESGREIDEMKLHKLLYFSQRECLAVLNKPMFNECFQGWKYGPVCPVIRGNYTEDGIYAETLPVSDESAYIIKNVIAQYGFIESWKLSKMTHKEISWLNSRKGLKDGENGSEELLIDDIAIDAQKVRPYDSIWDMYYDEFEDGDIQ